MQTDVAFRVNRSKGEILEDLTAQGVVARCEPRGPGVTIVGFDDPDGNFMEIFPNVETMELPPDASCHSQDLDRVMAECAVRLENLASRNEDGQTVGPIAPPPSTSQLSLTSEPLLQVAPRAS